MIFKKKKGFAPIVIQNISSQYFFVSRSGEGKQFLEVALTLCLIMKYFKLIYFVSGKTIEFIHQASSAVK